MTRLDHPLKAIFDPKTQYGSRGYTAQIGRPLPRSLAIGTATETDTAGAIVRGFTGTWTTRTSAQAIAYNDICYAPSLGLYLAVGSISNGTSNCGMTSTNGITWTTRAIALNAILLTCCWSEALGLFVAAGNQSNQLYTSPDGTTWTTRTCQSAIWRGVTFAPSLGLFVAVGGNGAIQTSTTGTSGWTSRTSPTGNAWQSVAWSPSLGLFAAVSSSGGTADRVMTSPDGITWTTRTSAGTSLNLMDICWSPELGKFVAVGTNSVRGMTSTDGITWTAFSSIASVTWNGVCWSPDLSKFVAVNSDNTDSPTRHRAAISSDGSTWTNMNTTGTAGGTPGGSQWQDVIWAATVSRFIAVGNGISGATGVMTAE